MSGTSNLCEEYACMCQKVPFMWRVEGECRLLLGEKEFLSRVVRIPVYDGLHFVSLYTHQSRPSFSVSTHRYDVQTTILAKDAGD